MKFKTLLIVGILFSLLSCNQKTQKLTHEQIVQGFFKEYNKQNFEKMSEYLSDSVKYLTGEYLVAGSIDEFYSVLFQWDSVFSAQYTISDIENINGAFEFTMAKTCKRIQFLHDTATVSRMKIEFGDNKILSINEVESIVFDFEKWQNKRDTLVKWIDENHPELSGFVYDMSLKGAQNYLKAIELYTNR